MNCEERQAMDGVESSGHVFRTPRKACDIKRKSKKKRKAEPHDGDDACAICNDGGFVTWSFHLTEEHGEGSKCPSIGLTSKEAKMIIDKKDFICKNCKYKQHQCSACGLLGSSDLSSGAEVFKLCVMEKRIRMIRIRSLQYAGSAQQHITGSVCQVISPLQRRKAPMATFFKGRGMAFFVIKF